MVAEPHSGQRRDESHRTVPHAAQAMLRIGFSGARLGKSRFRAGGCPSA